MKQTNYKSSSSWKLISNLVRPTALVGSMVSLDNPLGLSVLFNRIGWRIISACSDRKVKLSKRLVILHNFIGYLLQMRKHHGATVVVKYLKASQLAVQKQLGKDKVTSLKELEPGLPLPRLTRSSLPRIIPLADRRAIGSGNVFVIRFWLTLFSLYRVISIPGKLKLQTITDPFSGNSDFLERGSSEIKNIILKNMDRFNKDHLFKDYGLLFIEKASPTYKSSWMGWFSDLFVLERVGLLSHLQVLMAETRQEKLRNLSKLIMNFNQFYKGFPLLFKNSKRGDSDVIGQLSIKEEAAGKVRVFALVDIWTQSVLKPIHEFLFAFLRGLPNDGTFDQHASVKRCMKKSLDNKCSFGYDLSAATDRLPISLQVAVLSTLIGEKAALAWKEVLVGRSYVLSDAKYGKATLRYSVGQPMGALSSWAMLAVTHHLIVQQAWARCPGIKPGIVWFEDYELLGDDIVIFNADVAREYLYLMEQYGVPINTSKSVVAKNATFEFAKVTGHNGQNVTALSWRMFLSQQSFMGRANIFFSLMRKDLYTRPISALRRITAKTRFDEGLTPLALASVLTMLVNSSRIEFEDLLRVLRDPRKPIQKRFQGWLLDIVPKRLEMALVELLSSAECVRPSVLMDENLWRLEVPWVRAGLVAPIKKFTSWWESRDNAHELVSDVLDFLLPNLIQTNHRVIDDDGHNRDFWFMDSNWRILYTEFYAMILHKLRKSAPSFYQYDVNVNTNLIPSLLLRNEEKQSLENLFSLVKRGKDKLAGLEESAASKTKSPLAVLKWLSKVDWSSIPTDAFDRGPLIPHKIGASGLRVSGVSPLRGLRASSMGAVSGFTNLKSGTKLPKFKKIQLDGGGTVAQESSWLGAGLKRSRVTPIVLQRNGYMAQLYSFLAGLLSMTFIIVIYENFVRGDLVSPHEDDRPVFWWSSDELPIIETVPQGDLIWVLLGVSLFLVAAFLCVDLGFRPDIPPAGSGSTQLPYLEVPTVVTGPVSPQTLHQVQMDLAVRAWEANLDLSPIGALWG